MPHIIGTCGHKIRGVLAPDYYSIGGDNPGAYLLLCDACRMAIQTRVRLNADLPQGEPLEGVIMPDVADAYYEAMKEVRGQEAPGLATKP